jgi:hypothetical protein
MKETFRAHDFNGSVTNPALCKVPQQYYLLLF